MYKTPNAETDWDQGSASGSAKENVAVRSGAMPRMRSRRGQSRSVSTHRLPRRSWEQKLCQQQRKGEVAVRGGATPTVRDRSDPFCNWS